jgi:hypothetical protein
MYIDDYFERGEDKGKANNNVTHNAQLPEKELDSDSYENPNKDNNVVINIEKPHNNEIYTNRPLKDAEEMANGNALQDNEVDNNKLQLKDNMNPDDAVDPKIFNNYQRNSLISNNQKPRDIIKTIEKNYKQYSITIPDLDYLHHNERLKYDKRDFKKYLKDDLIKTHSLFSMLCKYSITDPIGIRTSKIIFMFSFIFGYNALLYNDDYIDFNREHTTVKFI